jgi:hypothetical protein
MADDGDDTHTAPRGRSDAEQELLNRQMSELLGELRVALPGVQVLFAFLLTVPFAQGFTRVSDFQQDMYFLSLIAAAVATALLIAPTALHRIRFGRGEKPFLLRVSNATTIAGLAALAIAIVAAVLLVSDYLLDSTTAIIISGCLAALFAVLWFLFPLLAPNRDND